mgnify:CR=1 FL=1
MRTKTRSNANTPNNFISVLDYGVVVEPTRDLALAAGSQSVAIQRAFDSVEDGTCLLFPPGHYVLEATVSTDRSLHIEATGAKFFINAPVAGFRFDATENAQQISLHESYDVDTRKLLIKKVDDEGIPFTFNDSQLFKIVSKAVDYGNRDSGNDAAQYRSGEWTYANTLVDEGDHFRVKMKNPLRFPKGVSYIDINPGEEDFINAYDLTYDASDGSTNNPLYPKVLILSGATMSWNGGEIEFVRGKETINETGSTTKALWRQQCLVINGYTAPTVNNLKINFGYQVGILLDGSVHAKVTNCLIQNLVNNTGRGNFGYGVIEGGTFMGNISQCTFINTRHGYTTGANRFDWNDLASGQTDADVNPNYKLNRLQSGKTQSSIIADCHGSGQLSTPFDTHMDGEDIIFNNCITEGGESGFSIRGRGIILNNCKAMNHIRPFLIYTEYEKTSDNNDDLFTASKPAGATTCALINCQADCVNGEPVKIGACRQVFLSNLVLRNTNHQMIVNNGSKVIYTGIHDYKVHDYDGRFEIESAPDWTGEGDYRYAVIETTAGGNSFDPYWTTRNIIESNCVINIDMAKAMPIDSLSLTADPNPTELADYLTGDLALFRGIRSYRATKDENGDALPDNSLPGGLDHPDNKILTYLNINGIVRAKLGPAFKYLLTSYGWITGSGSEEGNLIYSLVDTNGDALPGDDPSFSLPLYGHTFRAESSDGAIYYDNSTLKPKLDVKPTTFETFNSDGSEFNYRPKVSLAHLMDIPGTYVKQVFKFFRPVGTGSPVVKFRIGSRAFLPDLTSAEVTAAVSAVTVGDVIMSGNFAEAEVIVFPGEPDGNVPDLREMRVFFKFTSDNGTYESTYNEIISNFDRLRDWVTSISVTSTSGNIIEIAQSELTASAIASQKIFDIEYERIT